MDNGIFNENSSNVVDNRGNDARVGHLGNIPCHVVLLSKLVAVYHKQPDKQAGTRLQELLRELLSLPTKERSCKSRP